MTLEDALNAAMLADPDGGPWETALAEALASALDQIEGEGYSRFTPEDTILTEYRAAMQRRAEEG